jgi:hypothetical protein
MSKLREKLYDGLLNSDDLCEGIVDNAMIQFAEFLRNKTAQTKNGGYKLYSDFEIYNLQELLQIFKEKYYE